jgi:peptide/nickel transport system permease protein
MRDRDLLRVLRNPALLIGLAGVIVLGLVALFGPQLTSADPQAQRIVIFFPDGDFAVPPVPPNPYYPLGTDPLGRDQLARLLWGARLTFTVVLLALGLRTLLALVVGVAGAWRGGATDQLATLLTDAVSGFPQLLLALLLAIALRDQAIVGFVIALGLVGWAESAKFVRAEVLRVRAAPYVESARAIGGRTTGILRRHVLRALAPQLFGLVALEAGATLLLLAELGFLGVFMSGAIFQTDDVGRPILPVRDRAPEWGQMLAGALQYAFSNQYVAFVPGVVVAGSVFVFNLLGEGLKSASDPFSSLSLSPRALGAIGRGLAAFALVSAAFFGISEARTTELSFEDATRLAREAVDRFEPGDEMIAGVVRFASDAHGLAKPSKYNFYFRRPGASAFLRVGFPDADQNAMELKRFDDEDRLVYDLMTVPRDWTISWRDALATAETQGGTAYRSGLRQWLVRVVLTAREERTYYRAIYTPPNASGLPGVDAVVDARTGATVESAEMRAFGLRMRAEGILSGVVAMTSASASWRSASAPPPQRGYGAERPQSFGASFIRSDLPNDLRVAFLSVNNTPPSATGFATSGGSPGANVVSNNPRPLPLPVAVDVERAFAAAEAAGGREARAGLDDWIANVNASVQNGVLVVSVFYIVPTRGTSLGQYRYDPVADRATRTGP